MDAVIYPAHLYCDDLRLGFSMRNSGRLCSSYALNAARMRLMHNNSDTTAQHSAAFVAQCSTMRASHNKTATMSSGRY